MREMKKDAPGPVDAFDEMTVGALGVRLHCGELMGAENDFDEIGLCSTPDEWDRLRDGDLSTLAAPGESGRGDRVDQSDRIDWGYE